MAPASETTLAERLTQAMGGKTAGFVAGISGVDRQYITDMRNGRTKRPGYDTILKLSAALRVTPNWLYYGDEAAAPRWLISREQLKGWLSGELFQQIESVIDAEVERKIAERVNNIPKRRSFIPIKLTAAGVRYLERSGAVKGRVAAGVPLLVTEDIRAEWEPAYYDLADLNWPEAG